MVAEKVRFIVDGQWATDYIRSMFWDEKADYSRIEDTVAALFGFPNADDMTPSFTRAFQQDLAAVIEFRKRFSGTNSFVLEDEPEEMYRPMSLALHEAQQREAIRKIREDIEQHPYDYVDPWSATKSISIAEMMWQNKFSNNIDGIFDFMDFMRTRSDGSGKYLEGAWEGTDCGLWLLFRPELIYKAGGRKGVEADGFWDNIYHLTEKDAALAERNARYIKEAAFDPTSTYFDKDQWNIWQNRQQRTEQEYERYLVECGREFLGEPRFMTDEEYNLMTPEEFDASDFYRIERSLFTGQDDLFNYTGLPDDIKLSYGLVDRSGKWYSCGFAGHERKAEAILITNWKDFDFSDADKFVSDYGERYPSSLVDVESRMDAVAFCSGHNALDFIIERCGFIAVRWLPSLGDYLTYPSDPSWKATSAQKNKIWDAAVEYDLRFTQGEEVII